MGARTLNQADVDRIMDSGQAIGAMRSAVDDTEFGEDALLDEEGREDWRGNLTGHQMRRWVRRNWHGGERGFIDDNDLGKDADMANADARRKAAQRGADAGRKRKPRGANPYPDSDNRHEVWDAAYRVSTEEVAR